jgi:hypothetical protein
MYVVSVLRTVRLAGTVQYCPLQLTGSRSAVQYSTVLLLLLYDTLLNPIRHFGDVETCLHCEDIRADRKHLGR